MIPAFRTLFDNARDPATAANALGLNPIPTERIKDDAVTDAKLRNSGALSVIGRSANTTGDPADISASAASGAVLRENGNTLGFGTVATAGIADDAVSNGKLRNSAALSVIGRSANSTGDPADISASASSDAVLRESGSTVGFGTVATAGIADDAITNAKLANMAQSTVKGRAAAAGTGDPVDLTVAQLVAILGIPANIRVFTSGGTYPTVTNGDVKILAMCKGAGGSGGGSNVGGNSFGGGGGEGEESWKLTTASALSGQTVTVGAGGTGIAANTNSNGNNGNATSIGTVVTANGGGGGGACTAGSGAAGSGGSGGTKDWGWPGASGHGGSLNAATTVNCGQGGGKGGAANIGTNGTANSGGGGGGGFSTSTGSGAGGSGIVVCIEFGVI